MGRPTVITPETVRILLDAFSWGANNSEACLLANVSDSVFYQKMKDDEDFSDKINAAKNLPLLHAKKTVHEAAKTDKQSAQWLLERRRKDEYAPRTELTGSEGVPLGYIHSGDLKQLEVDQPKQLTEGTNEQP